MKEGKECDNCLPGRLGRCGNRVINAAADKTHTQTSTPNNAHSSLRQPSTESSHQLYHHQCEQEEELDSNSTKENNKESPLPPFQPASEPSFVWGEVDGECFIKLIDACYKEVVHWRRNYFMIPSGKAGKDFVTELTRLLRAFADGSTLECVALKAAMVMPPLLLQRTSKNSKSRDHTVLLECRLIEWRKGNINALLYEGRTLQSRLPKHGQRTKSKEQLAHMFSQMMAKGKVKDALCLLSNKAKGKVLPLDGEVPGSQDKNVHQILQEKHPPAKPVNPSAVLEVSEPLGPHPAIFDSIDGDLIRQVTIRMNGAAGPSGLDAASWKRLCTSFRAQSTDLCDSIGKLARRLATEFIDPSALAPLTACRLIALDKTPGVRPIGVGEVLRRIISRAISLTLRLDIKEAAGPLQLCAGHESGCEAAVHTMREIYNDPATEGVLLIDASNAFNSLNRKTALRNIRALCPPLATFLINTYRNDVNLFIDGETILSSEGTTQGDPLGMAMYAIATVPLIHRLSSVPVKQIWYADDAGAGGNLDGLRSWWDQLCCEGKNFGYYTNSSKSCLVVKEEKLAEARAIFDGSGISITSEGHNYLGAAIGIESFVKNYAADKVQAFLEEIDKLTTIAATQPHAAYSALTHGLSSKWTYLSRTIPDISSILQPIEQKLHREFLPSITGQNPFNQNERNLMALPVRLGGLAVKNPAENCSSFENSNFVTAPLRKLLHEQSETLPYQSLCDQIEAKNEVKKRIRQAQEEASTNLTDALPAPLQRAVNIAKEKGASSWLTTLPIAEHGFSLHKGDFRDALCLRYDWKPKGLPSRCVCDKAFTVEHSLSCPRGGFPSLRHNELRDITAKCMSEVCHNVGVEPPLQPLTGEAMSYRTANIEDGARLDIMAQGFWGGDKVRAFFDVRVFNPFAHTYQNQSLTATFHKHEQEKRRAYDQRIREVEHSYFSPLVFTSSGGMGPTAKVVYKKLASMLAMKQNRPYSQTMDWLRCTLSFSLLRSAIMCLRGSRSRAGQPAHHNLELDGGTIDRAINDSRLACSQDTA